VGSSNGRLELEDRGRILGPSSSMGHWEGRLGQSPSMGHWEGRVAQDYGEVKQQGHEGRRKKVST